MSATTSPSFAAPRVSRRPAPFAPILAALRTWSRARATESALAELTDQQLNDIGLSRGEIPDVAAALARRG